MKRPGYQITEEDYRRIGPQLRAKARAFGIPQAEVDDLLQETFLHAQRALDKGKFDGRSAFDTWVVGIGKNRALKWHRSQGAAKRDGVELPIDATSSDEHPGAPPLETTAPPPDRVVVDRETLRRVEASIDELSPKLREPLLLVAEGLSYRQTATVLGISTALVTSRVHQARETLRRQHPRPAQRPSA